MLVLEVEEVVVLPVIFSSGFTNTNTRVPRRETRRKLARTSRPDEDQGSNPPIAGRFYACCARINRKVHAISLHDMLVSHYRCNPPPRVPEFFSPDGLK